MTEELPEDSRGALGAAERMREVLASNGVSGSKAITTLAKICSISDTAVYKWYNGRTKIPAAAHPAAVARYYGVDLMWLITGVGYQGHPEPHDLESNEEEPASDSKNSSEDSALGMSLMGNSQQVSSAGARLSLVK